jgi:hypothetical protein
VTGMSEFKISRRLNGVEAIRPDFERLLREYIAQHDELRNQLLKEEVDNILGEQTEDGASA